MTNPTPNPAADAAEIRRSLTMLCQQGAVCELRVLNTNKRTVSGYYDDFNALTSAALAWNGKAPGIYITLNTVNPDLLARSANRAKEYAQNTTADSDITHRRWLPIDFDPVRPSGISSTDQEHQAALDRAAACRDWLASQGWPDPIQADSGNGAHLLYAVDLPNDPKATELIRRCLLALAFWYDDDVVIVDRTNFNAARIWKLFGTTACKGSSTPDRPHRLSRIITSPARPQVVSQDQLSALAARLPHQEQSQGRQSRRTEDRSRSDGFDLDQWISNSGLTVDSTGPWQGGRRWILNPCPWNPDHADRGAYIVQLPSGAVAAGCHHNGCSGKGWHDLRDAVEPGWRQRSGPGGNSVYSVDSVYDSGEWEPPLPFVETSGPPFPTEALPELLLRYVRAVALSYQVPEDLVACLVLGVLAAACAGRATVRLGPDWVEPLNEYYVVVLPSGERKSATAREVTRPVEDKERELVKIAEPEVAEAKLLLEIQQSKLNNLKNALPKAKTDQERMQLMEAAQEAARVLAAISVPRVPRLLADDATPEAVASLLAEQGGRMAIVSTEGGIFEIIAGRYSSGSPNLDVYLKGHSGDPLRVDRKGRPSEFVAAPALTVLLTVQPDVIKSLANKPGFRGRGLLARFRYSLPSPMVGFRAVETPPVSAELRRLWERLVLDVLKLSDPPEGEEHSITFSQQAHQVFLQFRRETEQSLRPGAELGDLGDWGSKLAGAVARLAGHLHITHHAIDGRPWETPVSEATLRGAIAVGRHFQAHAKVAFGMMGADPRVEQARALWAVILHQAWEDFTVRDLWQHVRRRFKGMDELNAVLSYLTDLHYVRPAPSEDHFGPGRPLSTAYQVNPLARTQCTQNTQNSAPSGNFVDSVDSVYGSEKFDSALPGTGTTATKTNRRISL